jgi:Ohr subfamily peroxiredoxin
MTSKILFAGKTRNTSGPNGAAISQDGFLNLKVSDPHPAAEDLFGAAWAACYMGALQAAAAKRKVTLPTHPAVDAEIDLSLGSEGYFLTGRLAVTLDGLDREVAHDLIKLAHEICPYSKAVHGNVDVQTTLN